MRVVGVIPSRWGSTRFPGKSLAPIGGKPLIEWVLEACGRARRLDALVVATDDVRIAEAVSRVGGRAVMTRSDHPSGTDRVAEAAAGMGAEVIVNIQGDEPLIEPDLIDRLVEVMRADPAWDMATAAAPIDREADLSASTVVKVVRAASGRALYFSRSPIPFVRDHDLASGRGLHWRHIGIYAYRNAFLQRLVREPPCLLERAEKLEQLRALHLDGRIAVIETESAGIGVDTPQDVQYVEALMRGGAGDRR